MCEEQTDLNQSDEDAGGSNACTSGNHRGPCPGPGDPQVSNGGRCGETHDPESGTHPCQLTQLIRVLAADVRACRDELAAISQRQDQLAIEKQVLSQLYERCRELSENHHERDFLGPVFMSLIGLADRCRQGTASLKRSFRLRAEDPDVEISIALKTMIEARDSDRIEVENLLANFGVESFVHPEAKFNPAVQKCIQKTECSERDLHGTVARRIQPGYRRNGSILRPEYVAVHVYSANRR